MVSETAFGRLSDEAGNQEQSWVKRWQGGAIGKGRQLHWHKA